MIHKYSIHTYCNKNKTGPLKIVQGRSKWDNPNQNSKLGYSEIRWYRSLWVGLSHRTIFFLITKSENVDSFLTWKETPNNGIVGCRSKPGAITDWVVFVKALEVWFEPTESEDPTATLARLRQISTVKDYQIDPIRNLSKSNRGSEWGLHDLLFCGRAQRRSQTWCADV